MGRGCIHRDQQRGVRPGQLEGQRQPDAGLRRPPRSPGAAVRRLRQELELSERPMDGGPSARALRRRMRERRLPLHRRQPAGHESDHRTISRPELRRRDRYAGVEYGQLQDLSSAGLTTEAPPALVVWQYDEPLPASAQWNAGVQLALPYHTVLDVAYTGQHSYDFPNAVNINAIDFGTAFLGDTQDRTQ